MTQSRAALEDVEQTVALDAGDLDFFSHLPQPLHVVVLTEDWCETSVQYIPPLAKLAAAVKTLHLRFFLRDQNLDLMDAYLQDDVNRTIPTFVFFDQDFHELSHWQPHPLKIREMGRAMQRDLMATDPAFAGVPSGTSWPQLPKVAQERLMEANEAVRTATRDISNREVVREIRELVERGLSATA